MSKQVVDDVAITSAPPRHRTVLLTSLLVNNLVLFAVYAGVLGVLLPQQVSDLDPANKAGNLALVTSLSALATLFVQPIVGALSDRTRSRFGRRAPWIAVGGIGGGLCTIALQFGHAVLAIAAMWVLAQVLLNALQGPTTAIIADRVEPAGRGTASAFQGAGVAIGAAGGITFAGQQLHHVGFGYTVLGVAAIAMTVLFLLFNRDSPSTGLPLEPFRWGAFLRGFWISPRRHPDYAWAFGGRFFMVLGYQAIQNYTLYILTDYLKLDQDQAGSSYGVLSIITSVTMVIGTVAFGRLSDVAGRRKIFVFAATVSLAVAVAIPLVVPTAGAMLVYAALAGIGYGAYSAVDLALMIDVLPSQGDLARDLGVLNIASNVPQTLTPLAAAALLGAFGGDYRSIFVYSMVAVAASSLFVLPIKSVR